MYYESTVMIVDLSNPSSKSQAQQKTGNKSASTREIRCEEMDRSIPNSCCCRIAETRGRPIDRHGILTSGFGDDRVVLARQRSPIDRDDSLRVKILQSVRLLVSIFLYDYDRVLVLYLSLEVARSHHREGKQSAWLPS